MYLLDTNVLSEVRKAKANQGVVNFFQTAYLRDEDLHISVITIGEILTGIEKLKRKNDLQQAEIIKTWFAEIVTDFYNKTLDFNEECAEQWSVLMADNLHNPIDKQIVATALVYDLTLVTRNVKDIEMTGVRFINPFS